MFLLFHAAERERGTGQGLISVMDDEVWRLEGPAVQVIPLPLPPWPFNFNSKKRGWYILWAEQLLVTGRQRASWLYAVPTYCLNQQESTDFHHCHVFTSSAAFHLNPLGEQWLCACWWLYKRMCFVQACICVCVSVLACKLQVLLLMFWMN